MIAILHNKLYVENLPKEQLVKFTYYADKKAVYNYEISGNYTILPSEAIQKLNIEKLTDRRKQHKPLNLKFKGKLRDPQQEIADMVFENGEARSCLVQAKCGWGKTYLGTYVVAKHNKPALIICHTKLLANQWYSELTKLLGEDIGFIGDGKYKVEPVTVGMYQSLIKRLPDLIDTFDLIIVDEAHRCPARIFSTVVNGLSSRVTIGLSATPTRKDGLHVLLSDFFGSVHLVAKDDNNILIPSVEIINTDIPFNVRDPKRDWARTLTTLTNNTKYLKLIADRINMKVAHGRCVLVIADRIDALNNLKELIPDSVLIIGKTEGREEILEKVGTTYKVVLSTTIFDEGVSCHRLDTIVFITPSNNPPKLEQRIGRIQREHPQKKEPLIMDFWLRGQIVSYQQRTRLKWYKKQKFKVAE